MPATILLAQKMGKELGRGEILQRAMQEFKIILLLQCLILLKSFITTIFLYILSMMLPLSDLSGITRY